MEFSAVQSPFSRLILHDTIHTHSLTHSLTHHISYVYTHIYAQQVHHIYIINVYMPY
jgi:hypothetical protein